MKYITIKKLLESFLLVVMKWYFRGVQTQYWKQECIPVGCVPPAAVVMGGFGPDPPEFPPWMLAWTWSPWIPPWVWAWIWSPLGVGLDLIPSISPLGVGMDLTPLNFPLGCGPGPDPPQFPPWVWAWRGVSLAGGSPWQRGLLGRGSPWQGGLPACTEADPPVDRITDTCKNITFPQLRLRAVIIWHYAFCDERNLAHFVVAFRTICCSFH